MKTSKITFFQMLLVNMGLLHTWNSNLKKKNEFQYLSWMLRHLKIGKVLTKVIIEVARKFIMGVFKRTALEPRSTISNQKHNPGQNTEKSNSSNLVIIIFGCTDLNSLWTISRSSKLRSFFDC